MIYNSLVIKLFGGILLKIGRFLSRIILILVLPLVIISAFAASLGFDSIFEMLKSLVENVLPFGNETAFVINYFYNTNIGKELTLMIIVSDIIKSLIASVLFTIFIPVVATFFPGSSKKPVQFFFIKILLAVFIALASGFILGKIEDKLMEHTYKVVPLVFLLVVFAVCTFFWFRHMLSYGFKLGFAGLYFVTGKLLPSFLRTFGVYTCLSTVLIVITDEALSMTIMPMVLVCFGIIMAISSLFEGGFANKLIGWAKN